MTALLTIPGADNDVQRLVGILDEVGPTPPTAVALMRGVGIEFKQMDDDIWAPVMPPTAFVSFINVAMRANAALRRLGLCMKRTGGRPCDRYWIEQFRSS